MGDLLCKEITKRYKMKADINIGVGITIGVILGGMVVAIIEAFI